MFLNIPGRSPATAVLATFAVIIDHAFSAEMLGCSRINTASALLGARLVHRRVGSLRHARSCSARGRAVAATFIGNGGRNLLWLLAVIAAAYEFHDATPTTGIATVAPFPLPWSDWSALPCRASRWSVPAEPQLSRYGRNGIDRRVSFGIRSCSTPDREHSRRAVRRIVVGGAFNSDTAAECAIA